MTHLSGMHWQRGRTRGVARDLKPERSNRETSRQKSTEKQCASCAARWKQDADYAEEMLENNHTHETMETWDRIAKGPQKTRLGAEKTNETSDDLPKWVAMADRKNKRAHKAP